MKHMDIGGTKFLEYKPENFGSNYAACSTIHEEKNEYEEQLDWDYRAHEYLDN